MFVSWTSIELSAWDSSSQQRVNLCLKMHFILIWVCFSRFNLGSAPHENSKLAQISKLAQHDLNMRCFFLWRPCNESLDLTDKIFKNKITLFILLCGKELLRCKKIYAAVDKDGITKSHESKIGFVGMVRRLPTRPTQIMYGPTTCGIYNIPKRVRQVMITTFCWLLRLVRWELAEVDSSSMQFHWSKITILVLLIPLVPGKL